MMKSFFKKLAFVMALAMVVSMVAPAGSALAAEAGVALQGTKTIVETYELEKAGATVDFAFEGCTTWKEYKNTDKWGWTSSNEAVATVNKAGLVTAVAAGTATITITVGDDYKESVVVTVKGEEAAEMAVVQLTEKSSKLVFNKKVDFDKEDAQLVRVFETDVETVEVNWPIDGWDLAKDGMSITFSPFVDYADGDKYIITVGDFTKEFTTEIGEVTHVFTTYKTGNVADTAFVTPEDSDEDVVTTLGVQIMSGTVDLTKVYADKFDISYEFYQDAEYDNANLDEDDGEITFSEKGAVTVTAVVSYEDEEGEDQLLANVMPVTINPENIPDYEVLKVVDWTTINAGTHAYNFSWNNKSLYAGDEGYQVVLKLEDNRGNYLTTAAVAATYENNAGNKNVYCPGEDSEFAEAGYAVEFHSTNTDDFLVDVDGSVATYKKTNAVIYVKLFKDDEDGDKTFVKNIYAFELKVDKAREITNIVVGDPGDKRDAVVDAVAADDAWKFTQVGFWIGAFDQSWTQWSKLPLVIDGTYDAAEFEVIATNPAELLDEGAEKNGGKPEDYYKYLWTIEDQGSAAYLTVDADEVYEKFGKTKVTFTIQEKETEKKVTVTVNLKKPTRVTETDLYDEKGALKETKYTTVVDDVRVLNENVVLSNRGQWSTPKQYIVLDLSKGQLDVDVDVADIDLGYVKDYGDGRSDDDNLIKGITKSASINLYKLSNDYRVAFYRDSDIKDVVANADWDDATTGIAVGDKYLAVINPKGKYVAAEDLTVNLLTQAASGKLTYAEAGKYTVYVYTVNKVTTDAKTGEITDIDYVERKDTFTVSYGQATVACADRVAIATEHDFGTKAAPKTDNIAKIIVESFAFTLDGKGWDIDEAANLVDMDKTTYTIKGDNIIIRSVTFKVPYDGGNTLVEGEAYYTKKVNVNMAVELVEE